MLKRINMSKKELEKQSSSFQEWTAQEVNPSIKSTKILAA
jgi:hypothetical protein